MYRRRGTPQEARPEPALRYDGGEGARQCDGCLHRDGDVAVPERAGHRLYDDGQLEREGARDDPYIVEDLEAPVRHPKRIMASNFSAITVSGGYMRI